MAKKNSAQPAGPEVRAGKSGRRPRGATSRATPRAGVGLAGFDFTGLNRQYMQRGGPAAANDAVNYGARVETIEIQPGQTYWKVIGIHHLLPDENRDRRNAFVEALDEAGNRVKDGALRLGWIWEGKTDGPAEPKRLDKPDDEPAADIPLEPDMTVTLWLEGAGPSERVAGVHTRHEDEVGPDGGRNSRFHHSYYIVFQRTKAAVGAGEHGGATGGATGGVTGGPTGGVTGGPTGGVTGGLTGTPTTTPFRFLRWPTDTLRIIQPFGVNPDWYRDFNLPGHEGVDIVAAENDPIYCVAPGQVKMVNTADAYQTNKHPYGIHVRVEHAAGYETVYAHLKELRVQEGQAVEAGQVLGLADHTGNVFGDPPDHLHLTLKHAGETAPGYRNNIIDPMPFLRPLLPKVDGGAPAGVGLLARRVAEKLGLNCNAPVESNGAISPRLLHPDLIRATGVGWVRLNFIVRPFAGPDDPRFVETYRQIIANLRGQGLQIYGLIGAEAVNTDPGNDFRNPPASGVVDHEWIRTYAQNFRKIVELFGRDVPIVESFNEPNDWHRTPDDPVKWEQAWIDPGWFTIMLQRVYKAVRDLDVTLVSGPLLSTEWGNDAAAYLPKVYQAGSERFGWGHPDAPIPFTGVGFHPYLGDSFNPQTEIPERYRRYVGEVRDVIGRFDAPDKPLYLSEIGWQNPDRQADCMEVGLACALDDPTVALCLWYGMQDDAEQYGLYGAGGLSTADRKPIYDRFVSVATNPRTVPAPVVRPKAAARFVAELDSVPDDTVLQPAQGFTKVWRLENTGGTTWGEGYRFVLVAGQTLGAPHILPVPQCRPGEIADFKVSFVTPPDAGEYTSAWSLADPQGNVFGQPVWTRIKVAPAPVSPAAPRALRRGVAPQAVAAPVAAPVAFAVAAGAPGLPGLEAVPVTAPGAPPLVAAALGIIYQTYWLRVRAAADEPDPQQAMQAAADDALARMRTLMQAEQT